MYNVTLRGVRTPLFQWKSTRHYIFWVCVCVCVALVITHAKRMCLIIFSCVLADSDIFFYVPHNGNYFREKIIEHKICVLIFGKTFA
jgi:hypothetical protein